MLSSSMKAIYIKALRTPLFLVYKKANRNPLVYAARKAVRTGTMVVVLAARAERGKATRAMITDYN